MAMESYKMFNEAVTAQNSDKLMELKNEGGVHILNEPQIIDLFRLAIEKSNFDIVLNLIEMLPSAIIVTELCTTDNVGVLKFCVDNDGALKQRILNGEYRVLHICAEYNSPKICEYLIGLGANVNETFKNFSSTPLHVACQYSNIEIVKLLCGTDGIEINKINSTKESALHLACCGHEKNVDIIKILLNAGVDVNLVDAAGETAFINACAVRSMPKVAHFWNEREKFNLIVDENNQHVRQLKIECADLFNWK